MRREHPEAYQLDGGRRQLGVVAGINAQLKAVSSGNGGKITFRGQRPEIPARVKLHTDPDGKERAKYPVAKAAWYKVEEFRGRGTQSSPAESQVSPHFIDRRMTSLS